MSTYLLNGAHRWRLSPAEPVIPAADAGEVLAASALLERCNELWRNAEADALAQMEHWREEAAAAAREEVMTQWLQAALGAQAELRQLVADNQRPLLALCQRIFTETLPQLGPDTAVPAMLERALAAVRAEHWLRVVTHPDGRAAAAAAVEQWRTRTGFTGAVTTAADAALQPLVMRVESDLAAVTFDLPAALEAALTRVARHGGA